MCGCCSRAVTSISRLKRSKLTPAARSGDSTLTTTRRPSASSSARNTRLMPPPPSSRSRRYASLRVVCSCSRRSVSKSATFATSEADGKAAPAGHALFPCDETHPDEIQTPRVLVPRSVGTNDSRVNTRTIHLVLLLAAPIGPAVARAQTPFTLAPCRIPGIEADIRCGTYWVFEDRIRRKGRKIPLNVIVLPSKSASPAPDPVWFVSPGGPGTTNSDLDRGRGTRS